MISTSTTPLVIDIDLPVIPLELTAVPKVIVLATEPSYSTSFASSAKVSFWSTLVAALA